MLLIRTDSFIRSIAGALFLLLCLATVGCNGISSGSGGSSPAGNGAGNGGGNPPGASSYSISGTLTPTANASGSTVTLSGTATGTTTADASGNYTFSGLANGSYTVTPSKTGFVFSPSKQTITVSSANITGLDFSNAAAQLWNIHGTITPVDSASGATVTLSGAGSASTTADASGNYVFSSLENGSYTVTPAKAGVIFTPYTQNAVVNASDVNGIDFLGASGCSGGHGVANFYVATNGNDSWSGTLDCPNLGNTDGPFASLARAQIAVESLLQSHPTASTVVMVREGTYYLPLSPTNPGTLSFTSIDSGTASVPVTWENYPDEVPVVSGGLPISGWTQVSGALWQVQLPSNTLPFEYLFYNGERRMRSRLQSSTAGTGYYEKGGSCISSQNQQIVSSSMCNLGTFLRVAAEVPPTGANANCPSVSNGSESKCLDRFQYNPQDPIAQWINLNPPSGNPCNAPSSGNYPSGDVELTLFDAWTVDVMRVSCVDTTNNIIYLTGATQGTATSYAFFGPTAGHRYVVENTRDAFNAEQAAGQTGIWFLDRSSTPWTLNYVANYQENPNTDTVVIPQLGGVIPGAPALDFVGGSLIFATQLNYVTFSGITFEMDDYIPASTGFNNDNTGQYAEPQAIDCESCQNVVFDGITVRHTSGSGIVIASTSGKSGVPATNDFVQNSAFYDMGSSGIRIGRNPWGSDQYAYVPQFLTVQNNIVQGYSRVFADGEGVPVGNGHDITIQHNDINDGYHAGISVCINGCYSSDWSANGINVVTQYNHIWNVMQGITSDGGALYYDIGLAVGSGTGDQILNNLVHDVNDSSIIDQGVTGTGYGGHGIYLDIQSAGVDVENNVVYRVSSVGLVMTQGPGPGEPANTFNNNIVAYARRGMFQEENSWPQNCSTALRVNVTHNVFNFDLNETSGFYPVPGCTDSCGMAYNQYQNFQGNLYWRTDGGFASDAKAFYILNSPPPPSQASTCIGLTDPSLFTNLNFSQWQTGKPLVNGQPLSMNEDLTGTGSVNPAFGTSGQPSDFLLTSSPIAGFDYTLTDDTINTAGRNNPVIMPPTVPGTFPTYYYTQF
jgi:hypothetical protein